MAMEQRQDLGQPSNRKDGTPVWTGRSDEDKTIHARYARREIRVNQPAFPCEWDYINTSRQAANGMTLRDYFAAKAMQGFLAYSIPRGVYAPPDNELANASYQLADAMLKAREA
jgi:hypothetical protein